MPRRTKVVTIPADSNNRDGGKSYVICEMAPQQSEWWGTRVVSALGRSASESISAIGRVDSEALGIGMAGVAALGIGLFGRIRPEEAKPLLDELIENVGFVYDPTKPMNVRGKHVHPYTNPTGMGLVEGDIEEVTTLLKLRAELFELHTGFSFAVFLSSCVQQMMTAFSIPSIQTSRE